MPPSLLPWRLATLGFVDPFIPTLPPAAFGNREDRLIARIAELARRDASTTVVDKCYAAGALDKRLLRVSGHQKT